nr:16S rRNA (uracil(1498)-N(3))-methyltransferase [uncultured Desulfuromonas sp.]
MNLILLSREDYISEHVVCLYGRRKEHVEHVHKAQVGDRLRVGNMDGNSGLGTIEELSAERLVMTICCETEPLDPSAVELVLALPRPKVLKRTLITATTLGIKQIHLINSWRVEKSFWQTPLLLKGHIHSFLVEGLEQSGDTLMPQVHCHRLFKPFAEDVLPKLLVGKQGVIAHPYTKEANAILTGQHYVLAIGPEGGFIPYEVDLLCQQGLQPLQLASRILKVETAVVCATTLLSKF